MAKQSCTQCYGIGTRLGKSGKSMPCGCVLRGIFRVCYRRFRLCATKEKHISQASLDVVPGREHRYSWGRKDEEYMADFILVSRRTLTPSEYQLFRFHFLLGADWKLCCRRLQIDRGNFFHLVYRVEQKLGRVFRDLQPYALFPVDEYFQTTTRAERPPLQRLPHIA